jgi:CxxC motif-containing protein (DUF1111 family)
MRKRPLLIVCVLSLVAYAAEAALIRHFSGAQGPPVDPGPRTGAIGAGGRLAGLSSNDTTLFTQAQAVFEKVVSVSGTVPQEPGKGLGPPLNLNSCSGCHAFPTVGGSSPATNPQVAMATDAGATNMVPSFITLSGPVREARFINVLPGTTPDGAVHPLYSIATRSDSPAGCTMAQPDFATNLANNNVIFRIPTPTFGAGFVESVPDANLIAA